MYWLYFVRDFYRTGQSDTAAPAPAISVDKSAPAAKRAACAAGRQTAYSVQSQPVDEPSPLSSCLQRLGIDGDHAFGVWDEESGFSLFSANFERITGLSSGECAGHEWIHRIHHSQQYAVNEALLAATMGYDGRCLVQAQRLSDSAEIRWLLMDVKAAGSQQHSIMVLFRDLTEQRALEEALKQTQSALAMSERGRAAFLSSMSHELRTPLNAIMGFSEMMKSAVFGELGNQTYREYVSHIHDSGASLLGKINDLLAIASMDADGIEIEESKFHIGDMLAEAIEIHTYQAFNRQQQLRLDCPHRIEMLGDRTKLICATAHLITNALRHSNDGTDITVSLRVQGDDGIIISVRDSGEGISTAQLGIIRTALAAEAAYFNIECGGIGLGLSITRELAARHGGRVMIDSVRHRGTVVSMILPTACVVSGLPVNRRRSQ